MDEVVEILDITKLFEFNSGNHLIRQLALKGSLTPSPTKGKAVNHGLNLSAALSAHSIGGASITSNTGKLPPSKSLPLEGRGAFRKSNNVAFLAKRRGGKQATQLP